MAKKTKFEQIPLEQVPLETVLGIPKKPKPENIVYEKLPKKTEPYKTHVTINS
jgi:hypothetical protein